jgi:hypothetical protein
LSETEVQQGNLSGSVSALTEGLAIEKSQYVYTTNYTIGSFHVPYNSRTLLQRHVASLGRTCSVAQKNDLLDRRRKLEARIAAYEQRISVVMKLDNDTVWPDEDGRVADIDLQLEEGSDDAVDFGSEGWFAPERERISLPSALAPGEIERLMLQSIALIEAELRKGQVSDALEGLRLALGEKSLCFRTEVRNADSQRTTTRAWDKVHKFDADAQKCRSIYRHARSALQHLQVDPKYLETLHAITDDDLKLAGDLTDERRFGQRSDTLPWFWRIGDTVEMNGPQMEECTYYNLSGSYPTDVLSVYRVSWLRAKARFERWSEELHLVGYKMQWTVNWFRWMEGQWRSRLSDLEDEERPPGLDCYCHKQMVLWSSLADQAQTKFTVLLGRPLDW